MPDPMRLLGLADSLLSPIHKLIEQVLPDFIGEDLRTPDTRKRIVATVDQLLVAQYPAAAAVPSGIRTTVIAGLLDVVLDHLLLGPPPTS
jgi:hypothetical protein